MILCRAVLLTLLSAAPFATAQDQPGLAQHPAAPAYTRPAPPEPLVAPATLDSPKAPNANPIYQALRNRAAAGQSFKVENLTLHRDAAELRLTAGTVTLYNEVNGHITGAVFQGQGTLHVEPPSAMERHQLKIVMKTEVLDQPFTTAALAFTDDTADELKSGSKGGAPGGEAMGPSTEMQTLFRKDLQYDLEERLLADILKPQPGRFFMANLKGPMFSKRLLFFDDPNGAFAVAPEAIGLLTSADGGYDVALGFGSVDQRSGAHAADNDAFSIPQQTISVQIEGNGKLTGKATALITAKQDGLRVLPMDLFPTLRATGVWGPRGEALDYIQEDKERDADFAIILNQPLSKGQTIQITTAYAGKDVVADAGGYNYNINGGAREDWYPNVRGSFGNYAHYHLTFQTPKDVQVVATGNRIHDDVKGKLRISEWQTNAPIPTAGFNLGQFTTDHSEHNPALQVTSYANTNPSDLTSQIQGVINGGAMATTGMLKRATSEGDAAISIYTDYFGPLQFDHVALTQQTACNYGQSWPMLVYLPVCYFWDSTIQHQLGVLDGDPSYWKVVTAHEVAHQWWGSTVGFSSYRDQWMSEGFADFSASLFLLQTNKDPRPYRDFWALERKLLLEKNAMGMRPVDVGPVVMGSRASSSRAGGSVYRTLIYPKGAYILHMLDSLYWTAKYGEGPFKAAMHDFVNTYRNRPASTEDFKASLENNLPPWMDLEKNHKLDWFFNAYVYGTDTPTYSITSTFEKTGDTTTVHFRVSQKTVGEDFLMSVPLSLEFEDKSVVLLGHATLKGPHDLEQTVNLGKLPKTPTKMLVNANYDILSAN